jgi:signal transduction histidine kinase
VQQAAQRHGGSVEVHNRTPHGSVFTMSLPGDRHLAAANRTAATHSDL